MRKSLLIVALLMVCQINFGYAQRMIEGPDSVCVRQPIQFKSKVPNEATHFWGFCSGYLLNNPVGVNLGQNFQFDGASAIEVVKDGDNYYGFVTNSTTKGFLRLEYGASLDNVPVVTNFGNLDNVLLETPASIYVVYDTAKRNWHVFLSGGSNASNSRLARIDFGKTLSNRPNIVNFGNLNNLLDRPTSLFVNKEADKWYGFFFNRNTNELMRMDMDTNISITPAITSLGIVAGAAISGPSDLSAVLDNGNWYFFVTNGADTSISRVDMGNTLTNTTPTGVNIGGLNSKIKNPSGLTFIRDCDSFYAFITNRTTNDFVRMEMVDITGPYTGTNFNAVGGMKGPSSISTIMRNRDNLYMFVTNFGDTSLTRVKFQQCSRVNIQSSLTNNPPPVQYDTAGLYNVYYAVNEGQPNMRVECKQIRVLPIPSFLMSNDTVLCQGDTAVFKITALNALSFTWTPNREITSTSSSDVKVWPSFSTDYRIVMPFSSTCIVDTVIKVDVRKVKADAGPDRTINDGAYTILGGPENIIGPGFTYEWKPIQYLSDRFSKNPTATPPNDFTYYIEVRDTSRILLSNGTITNCKAVDTVIVYVDCNDLNLPNAFVPESTGERAKFGLTNQKVVKLNYFNIYDRWGQQVFTTTDPTKKWDGKINGEDAPMGVYVWEADAFCVEGKRIHKSGNVTLIR